VSCSGITFVPNFNKITDSEVEKGEYVPTGNMVISQAYTFFFRMELSDQKEISFSLQVVNKCDIWQGLWFEPLAFPICQECVR
jgi:hypothetical protein